MDRSDVLELLTDSGSYDELHIWREQLTGQEVFCQVDSVTRSEFYEGGRNGLNPEYRFSVFAGDYNGETVARYDGQLYTIYRVYKARGDVVELYAERRGGTNGQQQNQP